MASWRSRNVGGGQRCGVVVVAVRRRRARAVAGFASSIVSVGSSCASSLGLALTWAKRFTE